MWRFFILLFVLAVCVSALSDELTEVQKRKIVWIIHTREQSVEKMRREISLYNLLNGLHLNEKQLFEIIRYAEEVKRLRERHLGKEQPREVSSLERELKILKKMQQQAKNLKEIPESLAEMYRDEVYGDSKKPDSREGGRLKYLKEVKKIEAEVENVLLPAQRQVLSDFKPCLIPPKNLRDPVRIGQAESNDHVVLLLSRMRSKGDHAPPEGFEKYLNRVEAHQGKLSPEERREIIAQWSKVLEEARAMPDEEFELLKEDLAARLEVPDKKQHLHDLLAEEAENRDLPGKTARFLLDPDVLPLLKARLTLMQHPVKSTPADLSKIEKAESCEDGKCAIED